MIWEGNRQSNNVEDARDGGGSPTRTRLGGGRSIGLGTIVIALVASWVFGINPMTLLGVLGGEGLGGAETVQQEPAGAPPAGDTMARFVSTVLADTEDVWRELFQRSGKTYREPKLRLFRGSEPTASPCRSRRVTRAPATMCTAARRTLRFIRHGTVPPPACAHDRWHERTSRRT